MANRDLSRLSPFGKRPGELTVVVESPLGSRSKFKYNPQADVFELSYVLPEGNFFPFEFGFIPSTLAADGDPLDIMLIADAPSAMGCIVTARALGVVEAEQTQDGRTFRNDRLVGVAVASATYASMTGLDELPPGLMNQIEHYFISYNEMRGRRFKPIRRAPANVALRLLHDAISACPGTDSSI